MIVRNTEREGQMFAPRGISCRIDRLNDFASVHATQSIPCGISKLLGVNRLNLFGKAIVTRFLHVFCLFRFCYTVLSYIHLPPDDKLRPWVIYVMVGKLSMPFFSICSSACPLPNSQIPKRYRSIPHPRIHWVML